MLLDWCILITLLCAVETSVIVNVFEENNADRSVRDSCNYQACDQLCRRLGFPGGACVGNKCKYDNFAPIRIKENKAVLGICDYGECDQLCRSLGFPGGTCFGDNCECIGYFKPFRVKGNKADDSMSDNCNYQACDQLCRWLGFPGGVCVGDKCKCDNVEPIRIKGKALDSLLTTNRGNIAPYSLEECDSQDCDKICHYLGFLGGICDGDKCFCRTESEAEYATQSDAEEDSNNMMNLKDMLKVAVKKCDYVKCNSACLRLNFSGGTCIGGNCQCY